MSIARITDPVAARYPRRRLGKPRTVPYFQDNRPYDGSPRMSVTSLRSGGRSGALSILITVGVCLFITAAGFGYIGSFSSSLQLYRSQIVAWLSSSTAIVTAMVLIAAFLLVFYRMTRPHHSRKTA